MQKRFSEITRDEWGEREWHNAASGGDEEMIFVPGFKRDAEAVAAALQQYDDLTTLTDKQRRALMPQPAEQRMLRFVKDGRHADLLFGTNPIGIEIRCFVDGEMMWTQTFRTSKDLAEHLSRIHSDFLSRGWMAVIAASA